MLRSRSLGLEGPLKQESHSMLKSPAYLTGRFSSLCRPSLPQFFLLVLLFFSAFDSPAAQAASPNSPSPLFAQRGRRPWWNPSTWSMTTKIEVGLGTFVLALVG